ncbi:chromobox protein homolog 7-like [Ranitomeya imitator]|uniref:chromobox protein homolog 7-like n=1 Tax=Ranitomeya imitator TaxID=111125 RepID=UPI0037E77EC8
MDDYEMNAIMGSKVVRGKRFYLLDWKGHGPEDRSWEPAEHIQAPQLIAAFERAAVKLAQQRLRSQRLAQAKTDVEQQMAVCRMSASGRPNEEEISAQVPAAPAGYPTMGEKD